MAGGEKQKKSSVWQSPTLQPSTRLELEHPELDEGVLLRTDPLPRGAVVVRADLSVQHTVHVRALPELDLAVRLSNDTTTFFSINKAINFFLPSE